MNARELLSAGLFVSWSLVCYLSGRRDGLVEARKMIRGESKSSTPTRAFVLAWACALVALLAGLYAFAELTSSLLLR